MRNMWSQVHCVVGKIHYLNVPRRDWRGQLLNEDDLPLRPGDRPAYEMGYLIYLKPSITGDEPARRARVRSSRPGVPA